MKVLVVGGGGREHAIAQALVAAGEVELYSAMARKNPGIAAIADRVLITSECEVGRIPAFAKDHNVDYAVIGPEAPLQAGIADRLIAEGIGCVGPCRAAARIETDKGFCRTMMDHYGISGCPKYRVFPHAAEAADFIRTHDTDLAIKPIGLTGGKGVRIMGEHFDREGAIAYTKQLTEGVVIEERLIGEEFTLQAFVDGYRIVSMPLVQDHKRAFEGDRGPNTGGMGSYSMEDHALPFVTREDIKKAGTIMTDVVAALDESGTPYQGVLYGQFMCTRSGPMVIEFNARFGDPEAMNVLSIIEGDFPAVVQGVAEGSLDPSAVSFSRSATVCKYLVPERYPETPDAGGGLTIGAYEPALLYYANVESLYQGLRTLTSRTLAFVGIGPTLAEAERIAERAASRVKGPVRYRRDIGTAASVAQRMSHMQALRGIGIGERRGGVSE
jgi:phosphoribosylamine--glycine ligase